jgi:hypothetical protein
VCGSDKSPIVSNNRDLFQRIKIRFLGIRKIILRVPPQKKGWATVVRHTACIVLWIYVHVSCASWRCIYIFIAEFHMTIELNRRFTHHWKWISMFVQFYGSHISPTSKFHRSNLTAEVAAETEMAAHALTASRKASACSSSPQIDLSVSSWTMTCGFVIQSLGIALRGWLGLCAF